MAENRHDRTEEIKNRSTYATNGTAALKEEYVAQPTPERKPLEQQNVQPKKQPKHAPAVHRNPEPYKQLALSAFVFAVIFALIALAVVTALVGHVNVQNNALRRANAQLDEEIQKAEEIIMQNAPTTEEMEQLIDEEGLIKITNANANP